MNATTRRDGAVTVPQSPAHLWRGEPIDFRCTRRSTNPTLEFQHAVCPAIDTLDREIPAGQAIAFSAVVKAHETAWGVRRLVVSPPTPQRFAVLRDLRPVAPTSPADAGALGGAGRIEAPHDRISARPRRLPDPLPDESTVTPLYLRPVRPQGARQPQSDGERGQEPPGRAPALGANPGHVSPPAGSSRTPE